MDRGNGRDAGMPRARYDDPGREATPEPDRLVDATDADDDADSDSDLNPDSIERNGPPRLLAPDEFPEGIDDQAAFRDQFDEDLYNDREDRPAQGNTADVAMGDHRFGSDAAAYSEYAWRRAGDHHRGDESAVGQSRDPSDSAGDERRR